MSTGNSEEKGAITQLKAVAHDLVYRMSTRNSEEKGIITQLKNVVLEVNPEGVLKDAQSAGLKATEIRDFRSQNGNFFLIEKLADEYAGRAKRWCAASGASAGIGGAGTAIALGVGDLANMAAQLYRLCQRLAIIHGFNPANPLQRERAQEIYLVALGFDAAARSVLKKELAKAAAKAGKPYATRNWMLKAIMEIAKRLGKEVTTKQAGRYLPVFGAFFGGSMNYLFAHKSAKKMQRMFKDDYFDRLQASSNQ